MIIYVDFFNLSNVVLFQFDFSLDIILRFDDCIV